MFIYHIVRPDAWENFTGSFYEAESLQSEGFIHCSFADQIDGVLERYYGDADSIIILGIDPQKLSSKLVVEPSTNNENYPHVYGPINRDAIVNESERKIKHG